MLEAVIFDMDGVILDSEPIHYQTEKIILERMGVKDYAFEAHAQYVGMRTRDLWQGHIEDYGLDATYQDLTTEGDAAYIKGLVEGDFQPIDGIIDLIKTIHQAGIKMIVASSASRENIQIVLDKFAILQYFEGYVSSQDVKRTKPNPDIFLLAAKNLQVDPTHCVVIEDAKHGVSAAKTANMSCIGYRNINSGNQDLSQSDHIVSHHIEINMALLKSLIKTESTNYVS